MKSVRFAVFLVLSVLAAAAPVFGSDEKGLRVGGTIEFSLGDPDIYTVPGPAFDAYRFGSIAKLDLYTRNEYIQAGFSVNLAQGLDNIKYVDYPELYEDGSPFVVDAAYIKFRNIAELFDLSLDISGSAISVGNLVASSRTLQPKSDRRFGVSAALIPGSYGDLVLEVLVNEDPGLPKRNIGNEAPEPAVPDEWGTQVTLGWDGSNLRAMLKGASLDLRHLPATWILGSELSFMFDEPLEFRLTGEFNAVASEGHSPGLGAASTGKLGWKGVALEGGYFWKNSRLGQDSVIPIVDARTDFSNVKDFSAAAFDVGISLKPLEVVGKNFLTLKGKYGQMLEGNTHRGWSAGADFVLQELISQPLMLSFGIGQYGKRDLGDFGNHNLLWNVTGKYDYHGVSIEAMFGVQPYDDPMILGKDSSSAVGYSITFSVAL